MCRCPYLFCPGSTLRGYCCPRAGCSQALASPNQIMPHTEACQISKMCKTGATNFLYLSWCPMANPSKLGRLCDYKEGALPCAHLIRPLISQAFRFKLVQCDSLCAVWKSWSWQGSMSLDALQSAQVVENTKQMFSILMIAPRIGKCIFSPVWPILDFWLGTTQPRVRGTCCIVACHFPESRSCSTFQCLRICL